ncbi:hypothetical protein Poli38472_001602 [Pythium oligandrum]|uniref:Uncharacterized protein n=1 Tax=Pythium oligandrum TaxID=41045 RepID=A0A8K1CVM3_PYTOL|nr:hypothetical protein Poli38472_001602 [Pythium oligandrum]|eukprot:TMW69446.1 hypothetical protein Poli38472_001602 [Pythium oligandrum]
MDKLPEDEAVSYLPTSTEMAQAVKWVKKNPALAIGVVAMGITSLSVAKYLEEDEEQNQPDEESQEEPEDSADNPQPLPEPMEPVLTLKTYKGRGVRTQSDMTVLCEPCPKRCRIVVVPAAEEIRQHPHQASMTFYRARVRMTRAMTRAMARSGNKQTNAATIERMIQNSKNRFGGAIGAPLATALSTAIDTGLVFHSAEFLFFNDGEDDDGT